MTKTIKFAALALVLLFNGGAPFFASAMPAVSIYDGRKPETVIQELIVNGYQVSWTPVAGNSPYTMTVIDLTTNTLHSQFSTNDTSHLFGLNELISGHTYLFTVTKGSSVDSLTTTI